MRFNGSRAVLATLLSVSLICSSSNTIAIAEVLAFEDAGSSATEVTAVEEAPVAEQPEVTSLEGEPVVSETSTQPVVTMPDGVTVSTDATAVDGTPVSDDIVEAVEKAGSDVSSLLDSEGNYVTDRDGDGVITLDDIDIPCSYRYDPEVLIAEAAVQNQAVTTSESSTRSAVMCTQVGLNLATTVHQPWTKTSQGIVGLDGVTIVPGAVHKGIDVSRWNGVIDWGKVKADGIDFAILKIGTVTRNADNKLVGHLDSQFLYNANECARLGIPYGVYLYTYSTCTETSQFEGNFVVSTLRDNNLHPQLPVYYDMEQGKSENDSSPDAPISLLPTLATLFCDTVSAGGYTPGVYSFLSWWRQYLTDPCFDRWDRWVAQLYSECTYDGSYHYWQCSWTGQVSGITKIDKYGNRVLADVDIDLDMVGGSWNSGPVTSRNVYTGNSVTGKWTRVYGQNHYDTMASVANADNVFASGRGGTVVVATGDAYWDALSANGLAGCFGAPVLITGGQELSWQTKSELQRLSPSKVIVMGGSLAISDSTYSAIKSACPKASVTRVYGQAQDDTAVAAYRAGTGWSKTCVIATSNGYFDALSIAPFAYAKHAPIFLTNADTGTLSADALKAIRDGGFTKVIIVGGTMAVPASVNSQLSSIGVSYERIGGTDHFDTSKNIAQWELSQGMTTNNMAVATANGYWDALSGASLVGKQNSILVLVGTDTGSYSALTSVYTPGRGGVSSGYVLGGPMALSDYVWSHL